MIKSSVAIRIGATISKSGQKALHVDGVTPLNIIGDTHLHLSRNDHTLKLDVLVVNDLDVDILGVIPFMTLNDISIRPDKHLITIGGSDVVHYDTSTPDPSRNRVRRTQAFVLRSGSPSTAVWPGSYIEVCLPPEIAPDSSLTIEPRSNAVKESQIWPPPHITEAVSDKIRIYNASKEPQLVNKHDHFCQIRFTSPFCNTADGVR